MTEGTNGLPRELEEKLVEAKEWYDKRQELPPNSYRLSDSEQKTIRDRWDDSGDDAIELLENIVEVIAETWGWAPKLKKAGD